MRVPRDVLAAAVTTAVLGACDLGAGDAQVVDLRAVVIDTSEPSVFDRRCAELGAQVAAAARDAAGPIGIVAFGLGDASTGDEPQLIADAAFTPTAHLYSADDDAASAWIAAVVARCKATITPSRTSPIYRAAARAVSALRARCSELAASGKSCHASMILISDLLETQDPRIAKALGAKTATSSDVPTLDLGSAARIDVRVCGESERAPTKHPMPVGRVEEVWSAVFGIAIVVAPTCPELEEPQ